MSKRWKLATKKEVETRDGLVQIKDCEGLWYQQQDMLSKFLRRPENIELICPTQFGKMFTTSGIKANKNAKDKLDGNESEEVQTEDKTKEIDNSDYDMNKKKFHFIITETDEMVPLPKLIEISDPYPGEPK